MGCVITDYASGASDCFLKQSLQQVAVEVVRTGSGRSEPHCARAVGDVDCVVYVSSCSVLSFHS